MGVELSEWYELVEESSLMQGDILEGCPVLRPSGDFPLPPEFGHLAENELLDGAVTVGLLDVVVITQSCDLVFDRKRDMWLVSLCPVWRLSEAEERNGYLKSSIGKEECRRGNIHGYHMLAASEHESWRREISIVSFREIYSLPLEYIRRWIEGQGPRPRLRSPYREHLAQAFARYYMRVGLPAEIEPFESARAEREVVKRLESMPADRRARILAAF